MAVEYNGKQIIAIIGVTPGADIVLLEPGVTPGVGLTDLVTVIGLANPATVGATTNWQGRLHWGTDAAAAANKAYLWAGVLGNAIPGPYIPLVNGKVRPGQILRFTAASGVAGTLFGTIFVSVAKNA